MSTDSISITLQERSVVRKRLNHLRSEGHVPAVIHDHGKESMHVMGDYTKLLKVYSQAGKHHPVELKIGNKQRLALIKDADFEPVKHRLRHVVFQAIKQNEEVEAEVPVVMVGEEIPAEKKSLLVLPQLDVIQVKALPKDLPNQLEVDATKLEDVGDHLYVSDIKVPAGVTILNDPEASLAVVEMPKDQIAEADAIAAEQAEDKGVAEEEAGEDSQTEAPAETSEETDEV